MFYYVFEGNELIFETNNEDLAFGMVSNIEEHGGFGYVTMEEEE